MEWVGAYEHKGLAVLTFGGYEIANLTPIEPILEWVMVLKIRGPVTFELIAVWAMNQRASNIAEFPHSNPQPAAALNTYWTDASGPTIIAGDFNHNVRWDKPGTPDKNHGKTLAAAKRAGLTSAYHHARDEEQGAETEPTLYWHGKSAGTKTYHIDYAFVPDAWLGRLRRVSVGTRAQWVTSGLSDHAPLIIDIDDH